MPSLGASSAGAPAASLHTDLALDALGKALYARTVGDENGLVHHSVRGLSLRKSQGGSLTLSGVL